MSAERKTETIPQWKQDEVDSIVEMVESYESVGVVNIAGIPSRQLQDMRRDLHGTAELRVSRNTLLRRALEEVDDGLEDLTQFVSGQVGLIGTNSNPFSLFQELEASKTPAPIGAGEVAPNDIVIPEGDTGVDPGPFVGELQAIGADARIQEGSIQVLSDSTVLDAGEEVSQDLANVLNELGIEPKEVGLDLRGVFADGVLFEPEELELDVEEYEQNIRAAAGQAFNLSVNAGYPTAQTVPTMLQSASGDAKSLALQAAIEDPEVVPDLVSKADAQVRALASQIDDEEALPEELQDVDAAPATEESTDDQTEDTASEDDADDAEAATDEAEDDDDDDEDAGDALGAMF
ncbi:MULTISPECIES: 50S ribosomal protein L10 [Haloarcula]|uniref:Large ribosomal subunit protein uL10 n=1 Tax=Haloarcula pellucida TaxID=1427151 RepID=A0A830GMU6_9EURY|nr:MULTISPECIES: 50S ribosomal protein L10 [Halomicroarcula]MBX0348009.1 50S ribosomal protein L10 [Halomicroarcula pellucida]MDS0280437.1 50S ribosomal protein L10 [Halomicroarcula sp. S1AR25-4]GGN96489.1 50S ribosomal protein L10 [Halomicroarcula pellucida]